jgi:hypothetical protein
MAGSGAVCAGIHGRPIALAIGSGDRGRDVEGLLTTNESEQANCFAVFVAPELVQGKRIEALVTGRVGGAIYLAEIPVEVCSSSR